MDILKELENLLGRARGREYCVLNASMGGVGVRRDELDGISYLVVPVVMIKEGVWNNVHYSVAELEDSVETWNNKPVSLNSHPGSGGWDKAKLEKFRGGFVLNVRVEDGKLKGELWIDVVKAGKASPGMVENMEAGKVYEVSTGLYCRVVGGSAVGIKGDHLAVLVDEEGACSVQDGAGAPRVNSKAVPVDGEVAISVNINEVDNSTKEEVMEKEKDTAPVVVENESAPVEESPAVVEEVKEEAAAPVENAEVVVEEPVVEEAPAVPVENAVEGEEPEVKVDATVAKALAFYNAKKVELVDGLVSNSRCAFGKEELEAKEVDELEKLQRMCEVVNYSGGVVVENSGGGVKISALPDPWK